MQVTPALPWGNTVEGGVIQLREPLTLQQLLDGALDVVLKDGHDVLNEGSFQIYPSDQRLYVGGSSLDYRITNVDTSSSSTQYTELILEKTPSADETLHSVSVHEPDVIVSPSLPWGDETEGGTISLRTPLSLSELLSGELVTVLETAESEQHFGVFKIDNGNSLAIISNGSMQYDVTNVDITDTVATYNELLITKRALDSYNLIQAYKRTNYFEYIPNLPMQQPADLQVSSYMGELYAQEPLTISRVISGIYSFVLFANGESIVANINQNGVSSFRLSINSENAMTGAVQAIEDTTIIKLEGLIGQSGPSLREVIINSIVLSPNLPWPLGVNCTIKLFKPLSFDEITRLITVRFSDGPQRADGVWYETESGGLGLKCLDYPMYKADDIRPDPSVKYNRIYLLRLDSSTNLQVIDVVLNES